MRPARLNTWTGPVGALILVLCFAVPVVSEPQEHRVEADHVQQQQWEDALTLLASGRFDDAAPLIHEISAKADDDRVRNIGQWVSVFEQLQAERRERTQEDYDKYVGWVNEEMEAGHWRLAILYSALAFNYALDQDAFRQEPWLLQAVEGSKAAAADYENEGKWLRAAGIWARLTEIFPLNKDYREALELCQAHIRLEYTYTPDSEWRTTVNNITPEMARDAFRKIRAEYLREPMFNEAAVAGLKQVLRLVQEPKLAEEFPRLADLKAVEEFSMRIGVHLRNAEESTRLSVDDLIRVFDRVRRINDELRLVPQGVLIYEFVLGALQPLDRFSDMIWPSDLAEFYKHTQGRFSGVGIQIRKDPGEPIRVMSPLEDTPAYRAGIQPGDLITKIDGRPSAKYSITQAVREITGHPGSFVTLTIRRPGEESEFDVKLERQEITIITVKGHERDTDGRWKYMIDPDGRIAYVRMTNFTEGSIDELKTVVARLRNQEGMHGLILDLRGNPGGPLKSAVDVSELFLDRGKQIVATKGRHGKPWQVASGDDVHFADFPLIVIVNRISASASEIVAGALQVHQRALIVGERTFGKGSVQQVLQLNSTNQAMLKLTTAHYYLPDGRCLHREEDATIWGVDPDVEVRLVPKEINKVAELRLKNDILKGVHQKELTEEELKAVTEYRRPGSTTRPADEAGTEEEAEEWDLEVADGDDEDEHEVARSDPNDWPEIDPQLEAALMLMRVRLASEWPWPAHAPKMAAGPVDPAGS